MTAATEVRISIREERTANSILLPVQLNGIVSENDFREFSFTILEQIRAYDLIVARRKKIIHFERIILGVSFGFVVYFIIRPAINMEVDSVRSYVIWALILFFGIGVLHVTGKLMEYILQPKILVLVDEQNEIYRNINATCVDMSQRVQASLTSSSPVTRFTTLLGLRAFTDGIGRYHNFEYIEFKMTTEGNESDTNNSHHDDDDDQNAPDSEQVALLLNVDNNNTHVLTSDTV